MDNISLLKITKENYQSLLTDDLMDIYVEQRIKFEQFHTNLMLELDFPEDTDWDKEKFKNQLLTWLDENQIILYFIMIDSQKIIGFSLVAYCYWYDNDPKKPTILSFFIQEQYRKQGIGKIASTMIIDDIKTKLNPNYITSSVFVNNLPGFMLSNSISFKIICQSVFTTIDKFRVYPLSQLEIVVIDKSNIDSIIGLEFGIRLLKIIENQYKKLYPAMLPQFFKRYFSIDNLIRNIDNEETNSFAVFIKQINNDEFENIGMLFFGVPRTIEKDINRFISVTMVDAISLDNDNSDILKGMFTSGLSILFKRYPNAICVANSPAVRLYGQRYTILNQLGFKAFTNHALIQLNNTNTVKTC